MQPREPQNEVHSKGDGSANMPLAFSSNKGKEKFSFGGGGGGVKAVVRQVVMWVLFLSSIVPFFVYGDANTTRSIFSLSAWLPSSTYAHSHGRSESDSEVEADRTAYASIRMVSYGQSKSEGDIMRAGVVLSPMLRAMLVFSCLFCTIVFPVAFDTLLRYSTGNRGLFSAAQLQSRNLHTQSIHLTCLAASVATALQGVVWILWGMQVGQISLAVVEVQPFDRSLAHALALAGGVASSSSSSSSLLSSVLVAAVWVCRSVASAWLMLLIADLSSYGYHRLGHENRWCWKYIHYLHHENHYPNHGFFSLQYGAVVDMLLSNCCFFLGFVVMHCDLFTLTLFSVSSTTIVTAGHSGLDLTHFPFLHRLFHPEFHAAHHWKFSVNYSEHFMIVDRLFGTLLLSSSSYSSSTSTHNMSAKLREDKHDDVRTPVTSFMKNASGA